MVINLSTSREQRNIALKYWVFFIFSYGKQIRWFWKMLCKLIQYFLKRFSELVCLLSSPSASAQLTLNSEFPVISWLMWVERPPKIHEICFVTSRIHRYIRSKAKRDLFFPWICLGLVLEIHFPSLQPSRDGNRFEPGGAQAQVVKPEQWSYIVGALDNPANSLSVRRAVKIHKCAGRHVLNT